MYASRPFFYLAGLVLMLYPALSSGQVSDQVTTSIVAVNDNLGLEQELGSSSAHPIGTQEFLPTTTSVQFAVTSEVRITGTMTRELEIEWSTLAGQNVVQPNFFGPTAPASGVEFEFGVETPADIFEDPLFNGLVDPNAVDDFEVFDTQGNIVFLGDFDVVLFSGPGINDGFGGFIRILSSTGDVGDLDFGGGRATIEYQVFNPGVQGIAINEVFFRGDATNDWVELINRGNLPVDISGWFLCSQFNYPLIDAGDILSGNPDLTLDPGEIIALRADIDLATAADLGLYQTAAFADPSALVDFVQWGTDADVGRVDVAATKGIWPQGQAGVFDFVDAGAVRESVGWCGSESGSGLLTSSDDFRTDLPTQGAANAIDCDLLFRDGFE